jgi:hypothetical protein
VRTPQLVFAHLRETDEADLAGGDEIRQRARGFFNRHLRVGAVEIIEIDDIRAQTFQARLAGRLDGLRPAIEHTLSVAKAEYAFAG